LKVFYLVSHFRFGLRPGGYFLVKVADADVAVVFVPQSANFLDLLLDFVANGLF